MAGDTRSFRVLVRAPGGAEIVSKVGEAAMPGPLLAPQWGSSVQQAGGEAAVSVAAPARDGQTIKFVIERNEGGVWQLVASGSPKVSQGRAQLSVTLPAARHGELGKQVRLRFRARTEDGVEVESLPSVLDFPAPAGVP